MGKLHHLSVGCADASVIQTATATFLIDCYDIDKHADLLPASKRLRGVFVTHQHTDHFAGLSYLRKQGYSIDFLIYSPYERRYGDQSVGHDEWNAFISHRDYFQKQGSGLRAPYQQENFAKPWWDTDGARFWVLGPVEATATSETRELHDASLVVKVNLGKRKCLFAGDASDTNLQDVARLNNICDDILHASHHGSINGADLGFVKKCKAQYTVISTEAGVFESVPDPTALRRYKDHTTHTVYRTDQDGTLTWTF